MSEGGRLAFINRSDGGVPKLPVHSARITVNGVDTDRHADTVHHGGSDRAICLYSLEHILALQAEGNPIYPGSIGENLTLTGVPRDAMVPGVTLDVADVRLMITSYTSPCRTIRESFTDHHISRISHKLYPAWSRVYACVLREGTVTVGDPIALLVP
jgi:MOSC domain-containing protein YiiM